jgi:hypothetical protein
VGEDDGTGNGTNVSNRPDLAGDGGAGSGAVGMLGSVNGGMLAARRRGSTGGSSSGGGGSETVPWDSAATARSGSDGGGGGSGGFGGVGDTGGGRRGEFGGTSGSDKFNTGSRLVMQHFKAMLTKKWLHTSRNRWTVVMQLLVPVVFVLLALVTAKNRAVLTEPPSRSLSLLGDTYGDTTIIVGTATSSDALSSRQRQTLYGAGPSDGDVLGSDDKVSNAGGRGSYSAGANHAAPVFREGAGAAWDGNLHKTGAPDWLERQLPEAASAAAKAVRQTTWAVGLNNSFYVADKGACMVPGHAYNPDATKEDKALYQRPNCIEYVLTLARPSVESSAPHKAKQQSVAHFNRHNVLALTTTINRTGAAGLRGWFNGEAYHSSAEALAFATNVILALQQQTGGERASNRSSGGDGSDDTAVMIETSNHPLPRGNTEAVDAARQSSTSQTVGGVWFLCPAFPRCSHL